MIDFIPNITVKPNSISFYNTIEKNFNTERKTRSLQNLKDNKTLGLVSYNARKRMRNAVTNIIYITKERQKLSHSKKTQQSNYKLSFATLTLPSPQVHSNEELRKYTLNQLLTELRKTYNIVFYLWKAEKQKNGNLHYHLIFDKYIPHNDLRKRWNRILNKGKVKGISEPFSYVKKYNSRMSKIFENGFKYQKHWKNSYSKQKKAYIKQMQLPENQRYLDPNSTDIHSLKSVRNIKAYISKYITKDITDDDRLRDMRKNLNDITTDLNSLYENTAWYTDKKILKVIKEKEEKKQDIQKAFDNLFETLSEQTITDSRVWFLSRELSKIKPASDIEQDYYDELKILQKYLDDKLMFTGEISIISKTFVTVWLVTVDELKELNLLGLYNLFYNNFYNQVKTYL